MFRGCGLFSYARRGGDLRKRGEMGAASSRVAPAEPDPVGLELSDDDARQLTWAEVEAATGGFTSPVIGHGGFSTVYLASFPASGRLGAVKVHCSSERLHRAFRQELDVLLSLRHPHIVRLLCYSDDEDEGALVFEYAPNGDLHQKLHSNNGEESALPWSRRVAVAFQLATALEYLHEGRQQAVVHGDVKASNVLLDAAMDAKLCDFGFARAGFVPAATAKHNQRHVMGSPGYVDPQLLRSGVATRKSDVYSFGVLLLELLTGKEAVCPATGHRLTAAVGPQLRDGGKVSDVVDPRLGDKYDAAEAAVVAELALQCVSDSPGLRPSMADVVRVLLEKTAVPAVGSKSDRK